MDYVYLNEGSGGKNRQGALAPMGQGTVGVDIIIEVRNLHNAAVNLTGYSVITARMEKQDTEAVTAVDGTLALYTAGPTAGADGLIKWTVSANDTGTDGLFNVVFSLTNGTDTYVTLPAEWLITDNPTVSASASGVLIGITQATSDWLDDEKAATEAADDGELLQSDGTNSEGSGVMAAAVLLKTGDTMTGQLNFSGTTHAGIKMLSLTSAERDALTPAEGMVIYNETTSTVQAYQGAAWVSVGSGAGGGISNIVEDTTPQLGGDLDLNTFDITGMVIGTNIQAYDADTAKLDVAQNWSAAQNLQDNELTRPKLKDVGETINAIGSIGGGTQDIDITLGNVVSGTVDTSTTTFTFSNPSASGTACSFTLILTNGGSQTVNWPASVDWAGATAPTLTAAGVDILTFLTLDGGTTWFGFAAGLDMS